MKPLNNAALSMPSSGIRKIMSLSENIDDCIHLEVGQPDLRAPEHILDAAAKAAKDGFLQYTNSAGIMGLREAIARKVTEKNGWQATPDNVVVSPGAVCSIYTSLLMLIEPGDEVLMPDPGWPNYTMQMTCVGARPAFYRLDPANGFDIDRAHLESLVTPKSKVLMLNTPGNPTGAVFSHEALEWVVSLARKHDLYILSDEIYQDIIYEKSHIPVAQFDSDGRVITISGFSKSYAAMGLRVGYAVCNENLAKVLTKVQEPVVSCASSVSQKACQAALEGSQEPMLKMVDEYRRRRDAVIEILRRHGLYQYTPSGAFYLLVDISKTGMNSTDFAVKLLDEKKVAVAPGETFGASTNSFIRVSYVVEIDSLKVGVEKLCESIKEYAV
ncbi:pyridoxal phosphate-dependent aminotransferase [Candidatus Latescibacterota bacterium]